MTSEGLELVDADLKDALNYLQGLKRKRFQISPADLKLHSDGKALFISVFKNGIKEYPVRKTFLYKLLRWYRFPISQLEHFSVETIVSICNDILLNIKRDYVNLLIENEEALTITSTDYHYISDIEVLNKCAALGVRTVFRNDFLMRINTEEIFQFEANPGDLFVTGLTIINSETGFHKPSILYHIIKLVCSNGALMKIRQNDEFEKIFFRYKRNELNELFDKQILLSRTDQFAIINSIKRLSKIPSSKHFDDVQTRLRKLIGKKSVLTFFDGFNRSSTLYDLFNHIMNKAKEFHFVKQIGIESIVGSLLLDD